MLVTVTCYYRVRWIEELWTISRWEPDFFHVLVETDVLQASEENEFMLHYSLSFNCGCPKVYIVNQTSARGDSVFLFYAFDPVSLHFNIPPDSCCAVCYPYTFQLQLSANFYMIACVHLLTLLPFMYKRQLCYANRFTLDVQYTRKLYDDY